MMDILLWLGALLMLVGFCSFAFGFFFLFDGLAMFMFGATWNTVLMMLERSGVV